MQQFKQISVIVAVAAIAAMMIGSVAFNEATALKSVKQLKAEIKAAKAALKKAKAKGQTEKYEALQAKIAKLQKQLAKAQAALEEDDPVGEGETGSSHTIDQSNNVAQSTSCITSGGAAGANGTGGNGGPISDSACSNVNTHNPINNGSNSS